MGCDFEHVLSTGFLNNNGEFDLKLVHYYELVGGFDGLETKRLFYCFGQCTEPK